jgi:hypothetical protein
MTEADQKREDDVLRRMLATKPKPHKDEPKKPRKRGDAAWPRGAQAK